MTPSAPTPSFLRNAALGITQILLWGGSYFFMAVIANPEATSMDFGSRFLPQFLGCMPWRSWHVRRGIRSRIRMLASPAGGNVAGRGNAYDSNLVFPGLQLMVLMGFAVETITL